MLGRTVALRVLVALLFQCAQREDSLPRMETDRHGFGRSICHTRFLIRVHPWLNDFGCGWAWLGRAASIRGFLLHRVDFREHGYDAQFSCLFAEIRADSLQGRCLRLPIASSASAGFVIGSNTRTLDEPHEPFGADCEVSVCPTYESAQEFQSGDWLYPH